MDEAKRIKALERRLDAIAGHLGSAMPSWVETHEEMADYFGYRCDRVQAMARATLCEDDTYCSKCYRLITAKQITTSCGKPTCTDCLESEAEDEQ